MEESSELHIAVEPEGLQVGPIVFQALTKVLIPILLAVFLIFPIVNRNVQELSLEATTSAGAPARDNAQAAAATKLNNYGVVDRAAGVYQIPVDRAMDLLVSQEASQTSRVVSSEMPQ